MKFRATLSSNERLKSRTQINKLFQKGNTLFSHPIKAFYLIRDNEEAEDNGLSIQFGVSVPKTLIKKAFQRIRLKRKIREAYRVEKIEFLSKLHTKDRHVDIFFIYIDKTRAEDRIEKATKNILKSLAELV